MTAEEIKNAFVNELKNTKEYQEVLNLKQLILDEIFKPSIQIFVILNFDAEKTEYQQELLKMCSMIEFGFECVVTSTYLSIVMSQFLK